MAVRFYDDALVKKITGWVRDPKMKITSPDETRRLFEYYGDIRDDKPIDLPLISIRRDRSIEIKQTNKKTLSYDGVHFESNAQVIDGKYISRTLQLNAIPITINYQIDIYTRYAQEADEYMRNFVFNIVNFPQLTIEIPYNSSNIEHHSNIRLVSTVEDNSDIPERLVAGQFTRFTIKLYIDDAYLFSAPIKDNIKVEPVVIVKE